MNFKKEIEYQMPLAVMTFHNVQGGIVKRGMFKDFFNVKDKVAKFDTSYKKYDFYHFFNTQRRQFVCGNTERQEINFFFFIAENVTLRNWLQNIEHFVTVISFESFILCY